MIIDQDAESLRGTATTVVGARGAVEAFVGSREVLHRDSIGGLASITISGLDAAGKSEAKAAGLELAPVSLQQLVIQKTNTSEKEFEVSAS
jgi:ABC-2 type transport system ATP-binding protein